MNPLDRHLAQQLHRAHPDLKVAGDLRLVELAGHAGQLKLAMQGLVGHAEQGPIGHPEAKSVGGNGGTFHVQRDGAALAEALDRPGLIAQLPVAVVDGGHRSRPHDPLQLIAVKLRHLGHRLLQRDLNFGQRRDGHPDRQIIVQDVILAHIGMGQHEIAQALRIAQAGAVTHHQPGMRAQHRDMVGRGLGIRRAHPDVDQGDALPVLPLQVIGRHLRQLGQQADRIVRTRNLLIPGGDEGCVAGPGVGQCRAGEGFEFIDIELVVGEQHVVLEMRRVRRRIMRQARQ